MTRLKISIVVATYNAGRTLARCLASVRAQTWRDVELIVSDGASKDDTLAICRDHADVVTKILSEPDTGIFQAWNRGVAATTGDWICFLGADDELAAPDTLAQVAEAAAHAEALGIRFVHFMVQPVDETGPRGNPIGHDLAPGGQQRMVCHPMALHSRRLFEEHGPFDETLRIAADYEFVYRELKDRPGLFVPLVVVNFRAGGLSTRPKNHLRQAREDLRVMRRHGLRVNRFAYCADVALSLPGVVVAGTLGPKAARAWHRAWAVLLRPFRRKTR